MSDQRARNILLKCLKSYLEVLEACKEDDEAYKILVSGLIFDSLEFFMDDVDIDELEIILINIENYLLSNNELSEEEFNAMMGKKK